MTRVRLGLLMPSTFSGEKWSFQRILAHSKKMKSELTKVRFPCEFLIDVREEIEIKNSGAIPNAINIPLRALEVALTYPAEFGEFVCRNNRSPPIPSKDQLIFTCQSGVRAERAALLAQSLGFEKVAFYPGSFSDWSAQINGENP